MGREILFRGKTPFAGTIGSDKWIESKSIRIQGNYVYLFIENKWVKVNTDTLVQYTGLKDKNGVKIFEGDIVRTKDSFFYNDGNYKIVYVKGGFIAEDKDESEEVTFGKDVSLDDFEVIGNIHDNPELLEEK